MVECVTCVDVGKVRISCQSCVAFDWPREVNRRIVAVGSSKPFAWWNARARVDGDAEDEGKEA